MHPSTGIFAYLWFSIFNVLINFFISQPISENIPFSINILSVNLDTISEKIICLPQRSLKYSMNYGSSSFQVFWKYQNVSFFLFSVPKFNLSSHFKPVTSLAQLIYEIWNLFSPQLHGFISNCRNEFSVFYQWIWTEIVCIDLNHP